MPACSLLLAAALAASPGGASSDKGYTVRSVSFEVQHEADGKKRPNQVKEHYRLDRDGTLRYTAYFGGVPIEMNHMDSIEWASGEHGKKVLAGVAALLGQFPVLEDDKPQPPVDANGVFLVGVTLKDADSTRFATKETKAWAAVQQLFGKLVAEFEKATGRPKTVGDLPQRPAR